MASDDLSTMVQSVAGFSFVNVNVDNGADVARALQTLAYCATLLFDAERDREIEFDPHMPEKILETMGSLLVQAGHMQTAQRRAMFRRWQKQGPERATELIERVKQNPGRRLTPEDLPSMFMGCPDGLEI
jgi:hypothetical protein